MSDETSRRKNMVLNADIFREVKTRTSLSIPVSLYNWEVANIPNLSNWVAIKLALERELTEGSPNAFVVACPGCHAEISSQIIERSGRCPNCGHVFKDVTKGAGK